MQYTQRPQVVQTHDSRYDHSPVKPTHFQRFLNEWAERQAINKDTAKVELSDLSAWENEGGAL
jgi:hypothetical protein